MKRIRKLRLGEGWNEFELARRARVHPSELSGLELGRRVPSAESVVLRRLARALHWQGDPAALLEEVGDDDREDM